MIKIFLLHGALGAGEQFKQLAASLESTKDVQVLDFPFHGKRASLAESSTFGIEQFGQSVLKEMDKLGLKQIDIFGYSMGGYVGLWLAEKFPERVRKVMTLATKFSWSPEAAEKEARMLNQEIMQEKVPDYVKRLGELHGKENWKGLVRSTALMMIELGNNPLLDSEALARISVPVQLMVGDRDAMVSIEETVSAYKVLTNGRLSIMPCTKHPLEKVSVQRLKFEIETFFSN